MACIDHLCLRGRLTESWKLSFDVYICIVYVNVYVCEMSLSVIAVYKILICGVDEQSLNPTLICTQKPWSAI